MSFSVFRRNRVGILLLAMFMGIILAGCPASQTPQQRAESLYSKGNQLWEQGKWIDAINSWEQATKVDPNYYDAWFQLGLGYKKIGDKLSSANPPDTDNAVKAYALSAQYYAKAIQINPNDPSSHNNLANVFFAVQKYDEAIEEYLKAISLKPYEPDYHYNLANTYSKKQMYKQAIEHYEESIRIDPNYFDAYYNIANLYEKMNDAQNAIRYYQEYVNRENRPSEAEWVNKARQKIQTLRGGGGIY
jgi:tetratricopeptide (TPR) repeat protein